MKRARETSKTDSLFEPYNGASPILRRRNQSISSAPDTDSDSDTEIIFTSQANKKRKMSGDEAMKLWISAEFSKQFATVATKEQLGTLITSVESNTATSQANANALARQQQELQNLRGSIEAIEMEIHGKRRRVETQTNKLSQIGNMTFAQTAGMSPRRSTAASSLLPVSRMRPERVEAERKQFEKARKSVRIWPVEGTDTASLKTNVIDFCRNALLLQGELGITSVERARSSPRGRAFLEAIVEFEDNVARDRVFACGPQLAGYRDKENKPTCGLRLQIPSHLMGQFRVLESYAFKYRNKHNQGEVKKHVKFDDFNNELFVQIKHLKDDDWINVSYAQAKEECERTNASKVKKSFLFQSPDKSAATSKSLSLIHI